MQPPWQALLVVSSLLLITDMVAKTYISKDAPKCPVGHTINLCRQVRVLILASCVILVDWGKDMTTPEGYQP